VSRALLVDHLKLRGKLIALGGRDLLVLALDKGLNVQTTDALVDLEVELYAPQLDVLAHFEALKPVERGDLVLEAFALAIGFSPALAQVKLAAIERGRFVELRGLDEALGGYVEGLDESVKTERLVPLLAEIDVLDTLEERRDRATLFEQWDEAALLAQRVAVVLRE